MWRYVEMKCTARYVEMCQKFNHVSEKKRLGGLGWQVDKMQNKADQPGRALA